MAVELQVELRLAGGRVVYSQSVDLSLAGIQLLCDRVTRDLVFPRGQPVGPADRPRLTLRMQLRRSAAPGAPGWIEAQVEGVIERRVGEDHYRLGLQFVDLDEDAARCLERFVVGGQSAGRQRSAG